MIGKGSIKMLK